MSRSVYDLHLRCQALGRSGHRPRHSAARRQALADEAARQRSIRLRDILRELRSQPRLWR
jgi:hypothetical protein